MLYVGIDVAKNKHDLAVIDELGTIIEKNFRFENSYTEFQNLQKQLSCLTGPFNDSILIALEDTGHYAYNLVFFYESLAILSSLTTPYSSKNLLSLYHYVRQRPM